MVAPRTPPHEGGGGLTPISKKRGFLSEILNQIHSGDQSGCGFRVSLTCDQAFSFLFSFFFSRADEARGKKIP